MPVRVIRLVGVAAACVGIGACGRGEAAGHDAPAASAKPGAASSAAAPSASVDTKGAPVAIPVPPDKVVKAVNPRNEQPYAGPSGTLTGTIRIKGDPPPDSGMTFPPDCPGEAAATYGKLFRVGQDGTVADVLVGVTGYTGYVPAREAVKTVTLRGCAASQRTIAVTYGQRIDVNNVDKLRSYMPYLDGGDAAAVMVAVPGGDAVRLYPQAVGHYLLRDELPKPFLTADVFALKYATLDVTGLDGKYRIAGVPVGKVRVSALLPAIGKTVEQDIELKPGDNNLDLTLEYKNDKATGGKPNDAATAAPKK